MTEGEVKVYTLDETAGLGVNPVDTNLNILALGVTDYGPTKLTRISGPVEFRRMYNAGQGITSSNHYSTQYVRALLNNAPLYFKRVIRESSLLGGIDSTRSDFYVDSQLNPISGSIVRINPAFNYVNDIVNNYATTYPSETSIIDNSNSTYIQPIVNGSSESNEFQKYAKDQQIYKSSISTSNISYLYFIRTGESDPRPATEGVEWTFTLTVGGDTLEAETIRSDSSGTWRTDTISRWISRLVNNTPDFVLSKGQVLRSDITPNNTLYGFGFMKNVSIDLTLSTDTPNDLFLKNNNYLSEVELIKVKSDNEYKKEYKISGNLDILIETTGNETTGNNFYDFYYGEKPDKGDKVIYLETESENLIDFYADFTNQLSIHTDLSTKSEYEFVIPNYVSATVTGSIISEPTFIGKVNEGIDFKKFGIVSKFPNKSNVIEITSLTKISEAKQIYHIDVKYSDIEESWDFSFIEGTVDGYGNDLSYTRVNGVNGSQLINIIPLSGDGFEEIPYEGEDHKKYTVLFGSQITSDNISNSNMANTLDYICEYDESPVLFDYIVDSGVPDANFARAIQSACDKYFAFYPASCVLNPDKQGKSDESRRDLLGNNPKVDWLKGNANYISAVQVDNFLDSGIAKFPGSLYYLMTRIGLATTSFEFQPIFAETNGNIGIKNPIVTYSKSKREKLLDKQIVSLDRNLSNNTYFINLNSTLKMTDSFLQEDGIALMNMKISQIAYLYGKTLRGLYNTYELRSSIHGKKSQLAKSIISRLRVGTQNGPDSIDIVCNSTNNPISLQNQRKIQIDIYARYNRSIKDVLVYSHVQSLAE